MAKIVKNSGKLRNSFVSIISFLLVCVSGHESGLNESHSTEHSLNQRNGNLTEVGSQFSTSNPSYVVWNKSLKNEEESLSTPNKEMHIHEIHHGTIDLIKNDENKEKLPTIYDLNDMPHETHNNGIDKEPGLMNHQVQSDSAHMKMKHMDHAGMDYVHVEHHSMNDHNKDQHDMDHDHEGHNDDHTDHDHMDHDGMDMNHTGGHMMMYFHTGVKETVLFKEWKITTVGGMIGSIIGIFLFGMLYEGLKYFREHLFKRYVSSIQFSTVAVTGESGRVTQVHKVERHVMMSWPHAIQTGLHVLQIVMSYFLMLVFMTYNVWLCLAIVLGAGVGYFIFGWKKASVVDITEHCH